MNGFPISEELNLAIDQMVAVNMQDAATARSSDRAALTRAVEAPAWPAEVSDLEFRIVATYSGPENSAMPKTLSIDQSMQISQQ